MSLVGDLVQRHLGEMSDEQLLQWVDDLVLSKLATPRLKRLASLLNERVEEREAGQRQVVAAFRGLSP